MITIDNKRRKLESIENTISYNSDLSFNNIKENLSIEIAPKPENRLSIDETQLRKYIEESPIFKSLISSQNLIINESLLNSCNSSPEFKPKIGQRRESENLINNIINKTNIINTTDTIDTNDNKENEISTKRDSKYFEISENMNLLDFKNILDNSYKNIKPIEQKYNKSEIHDYIFDYILFIYNFYNPIFTMYITILSYQQSNINTNYNILKSVTIYYALIYPLITMFILLQNSYNIFSKIFIYYKLLDNGTIFKWKKRTIYKLFYFWWYILSIVFISIALNDNWSTIVIFLNQTSNLLLYINDSLKKDRKLITLNHYFENNIKHQLTNMIGIKWMNEKSIELNIDGMILAREIINKKINDMINNLLKNIKNDKDESEDSTLEENKKSNENENNDNNKEIILYYKILNMCYLDDIRLSNIKIKPLIENKEISCCEKLYNYILSFCKREWTSKLLDEFKKNNNRIWNIECNYCKNINIKKAYYQCIKCKNIMCNKCKNKENRFDCYESKNRKHHLIVIKEETNEDIDDHFDTFNIPLCHQITDISVLNKNHVIYYLNIIYYMSIVSIILIEFYGFYYTIKSV